MSPRAWLYLFMAELLLVVAILCIWVTRLDRDIRAIQHSIEIHGWNQDG